VFLITCVRLKPSLRTYLFARSVHYLHARARLSVFRIALFSLSLSKVPSFNTQRDIYVVEVPSFTIQRRHYDDNKNNKNNLLFSYIYLFQHARNECVFTNLFQLRAYFAPSRDRAIYFSTITSMSSNKTNANLVNL